MTDTALTVKREQVLENIKDFSLAAGNASAELTSVLLDLFSAPGSTNSGKVLNAAERLELQLRWLKGALASLQLLNAVQGVDS